MTGGVARWFVHTITVETFTGTSGYGIDLFSAPMSVTGWFEGESKMVRTTTDEEVLSSSTVYTALANAALFPTDSRVTAPNGTVSRVIRRVIHDPGTLRLPGHVEVNLE